MTDAGKDVSPTPPPRSQSTRRQRAPTITINTSTGDQNEEPEEPAPLPSEASPTDRRAAHSFDSNRPTSPHNVSSPTSKWSDAQSHNFLAVPNPRSRGNSVDSEPTQSPTTYGSESSTTSLALTANSKFNPSQSNNDNIISDPNALKPDRGAEADFQVEDNKFAFSPGQLGKLFNPKSLAAFYAIGGLNGLETGLRTDRAAGLLLEEKGLDGVVSFEAAVAAGSQREPEPRSGHLIARTTSSMTSRMLSEDSFRDRKRIFKNNELPEKKPKGLLQLAWLAYNDKVLILLTAAAVISLALGIYQSVSQTDGEAPVEWVEGVAIMVAIIIVVAVGALNDWQKEKQFVKLNKKKEDRNVRVIRSGKSREISVHDLLVGDVMHLEPGDMVPVDGIFISGHNVKCDESSATGESDLLSKSSADEVFEAIERHHNVSKMDPFIISGARVAEGIGTFLVTAVGVNSCYGKTMVSLHEDAQETPLQTKLNVLAEYIAKLGLGAGLLLFVATFIKFLVQISGPDQGQSAGQKGQQFLNVFIVAVTIVVVAVPEGLPLAVTLALAFATTRMLKDNNLVRVLRACETMGNATTICSDKTGTLTQNRMTTVAGVLGTSSRFGSKRSLSSSISSTPDSPTKGKGVASEDDVEDPTIGAVVSALADDVRLLLKQSIAINSTAFEGEEAVDGKTTFIGSKTETALLTFARDHLGMTSVSDERANANIVQMVPFDSSRKCMAVVIKLGGKKYRLFVKGASEIMVSRCSRTIEDPFKEVSETSLAPADIESLKQTINEYASRSLRTIGLLYRDFEQWPPRGIPVQDDDPKLAVFDKFFKDMILLGIVGIQDPLRDGVRDAVHACQKAGVMVRMVTGDNVMTAKAIAEECGIFTPDGVILEGPEFRKLSRQEMKEKIPNLQVLARSSPKDKQTLVKRLKEYGETVAVTGDGTNDAPALKTADVGFSMGIAGTEVAKEASDIILMDDNFASIVKAIMWGRAVNDSVKKFLQFQITVNITAVILTFVSAVANSNENSVLSAVQLLWVNLIMDTFAALALATDPPTPSILDRKPEPKSAPLITITMWKMIIGQTLYQLVVTFILYFGGTKILSYQSEREQLQLPTLVFNTFVWMQIFNQYNNRRLDNKQNIFEGIHRNYFFVGIQFIIVAGQIMIIFVGGRAFDTRRLNGAQWGYSIILGLFSIPVAMALRLIPDHWIEKLIPSWFARTAKPKVMVTDEEQQFEWNPALEEIREELAFLKRLRGGRLTAIRYKLEHPTETIFPSSRSASSRSRSRSRTNSLPQTPTDDNRGSDNESPHLPATPSSRKSSTKRRIGRSRSNSAFGPAAAMAGIVAGSIGGWSPIGRRDEDGSVAYNQPEERYHLHDHEETSPAHASSQNNLIVPEQARNQVPEITSAPHNSLLAPPSRG